MVFQCVVYEHPSVRLVCYHVLHDWATNGGVFQRLRPYVTRTNNQGRSGMYKITLMIEYISRLLRTKRHLKMQTHNYPFSMLMTFTTSDFNLLISKEPEWIEFCINVCECMRGLYWFQNDTLFFLERWEVARSSLNVPAIFMSQNTRWRILCVHSIIYG